MTNGYDEAADNMRTSTHREGATLLRRSVRSYWPTVILVAVIVSIAAVLLAVARPAQFSSETELLLRPVAETPFSSATQHDKMIGLETEAKLVTSSDVIHRAGRIAPGTFRPDKDNVSASVVPDSQIIRISYTANSAYRAESGARAFGQALLDSRKDQAQKHRKRKIDKLQKQLKSADKEAEAAVKGDGKSSAAPGGQIRNLFKHLRTTKDKLAKAEAAPTNPGHFVKPPSSPGWLPQLVAPAIAGGGIVLGLLLGLAAAALRARLDDRVGSHELAIGETPVWARLDGPALGYGEQATRDEETDHEVYGQLRTAVLANIPRGSAIAVTSAIPSAVVASVSCKLALALQRSGYTVGVVDMDPDQPRVGDFFAKGLEQQPGISDILAGVAQLEEATIYRQGLSVLIAGTDPTVTREQSFGPTLPSVLNEMMGAHDYVVVAAAPLSSAVGTAVAAGAGRSILMVPESRSTGRQIADLVSRASARQVRTDGIVTFADSHTRTPKRPPSQGLKP